MGSAVDTRPRPFIATTRDREALAGCDAAVIGSRDPGTSVQAAVSVSFVQAIDLIETGIAVVCLWSPNTPGCPIGHHEGPGFLHPRRGKTIVDVRQALDDEHRRRVPPRAAGETPRGRSAAEVALRLVLREALESFPQGPTCPTRPVVDRLVEELRQPALRWALEQIWGDA